MRNPTLNVSFALFQELLARQGASAANAAAVVTMSIKDRVNRLRDAEYQWIENYKKTLEEWNEKNKVQFGLGWFFCSYLLCIL